MNKTKNPTPLTTCNHIRYLRFAYNTRRGEFYDYVKYRPVSIDTAERYDRIRVYIQNAAIWKVLSI